MSDQNVPILSWQCCDCNSDEYGYWYPTNQGGNLVPVIRVDAMVAKLKDIQATAHRCQQGCKDMPWIVTADEVDDLIRELEGGSDG